MDGSYREPSPGFQSHTGPKMLRKKGRGQVTRRLRLLDHNCRTWILTVFLQSSALPPRRMCIWWRLSRVSTTPGRALIIPRTWLASPCVVLGLTSPCVSSMVAPPTLSKLWVLSWALLEKASYKSDTSLFNILFPLMLSYP